MSNLMPEQRVNVLGHVVTKHVRANASATVRTMLPSPTLSPVSSNSEWSEVAPLILERIAEVADAPEDTLADIERVEPDTRRLVIDALLSDDKYSFTMALMLMEDEVPVAFPYVMQSLSFHRALLSEAAKELDDGTSERQHGILRGSYKGVIGCLQSTMLKFAPGGVTSERVAIFKTELLANNLNLRASYPVLFERYAALQDVSSNIDFIESALPALVQVNTGINHWRLENKKNVDAPFFDVPLILTIANIVKDRPDSEGCYYDYARDRGNFDPQGFIDVLDSPSRTLSPGVL